MDLIVYYKLIVMQERGGEERRGERMLIRETHDYK
jgi:hypothetical protein